MLGSKKHLHIIIGGLAVGIAAVLIVYFVMIATGVIQTTTDRVVITTADAEKIYDGEALVCEEFTVSEGDLPNGYTVKAIFTGTRTDAGRSENFATAVIYDSQGADVTSKYEIEYKYGALTVLPAPLDYFTQNAAKEYDGMALVSNHVEKRSGELLDGHSIDISAYGARTEVGTVQTSCEWTVTDSEGTDVSHNYKVNYTPGILTVRPIKLSYFSNDMQKLYDGTPLAATHYEQLGGELLAGHRAEITVRGERTDVGTTESVLFAKIFNSSGQDVSEYYQIDYKPGDITVLGRPIVIQTASDEKIYDGEVIVNDGWEHVAGELLGGHTLEVVVTGQRTMVGAANNVASVRVKDGSGLDVTRNYSVEFEYGILQVKGIPINIYSYDAEKEYDGTPLTEPRTPEITGELLPGHMLIAEAFGSQTEVGKSYNFIDAQVLDAEGEDVTSFYDLIFNYGVLTVLEPESERNSDEYMIINSSTGGNIYLREASYGNYMNGTWYGQKVFFDSNTKLNPIYFATESLKGGATLPTGTLSITLWRSTAQYTIPYYCTTYGATPENDAKPVGEFVRNEPYTVEMMFYEYSPDTIGNFAISSEYASLEARYAKFVKQYYLTVDKDMKEALLRIISANGIRADSATLVQDVVDYVQNAAEYKLGVSVPDGAEPILYFLEEGKEGKCTDFAGAATLIFRSLGIPARVTTGFLMADAKPGVDITVKAEHAHAWVEVYFDGIGWICVDPTPGDGGARGGSSIKVKPADVSVYWTKDSGILNHSGEIYNEGGIINAIKSTLGLSPYDSVVIDKKISAAPLSSPGATDAFVDSFTVYLNGEAIYNYDRGEVTVNTHELKFVFEVGSLKYYKYKITVTTTGTQSKEYDGERFELNSLLFDSYWTVDSEADPDVSRSDFDLSCKLVIPSDMTNVGRVYVAVSDVEVNTAIRESDYHIVYSYAYAEITRRSATVSADGDGNYFIDGLVAGHRMTKCNIDFEYNVFDIVITDDGGNDVTNNYSLILDIY